MSLQKKIQQIIDVINNSNIEEIEVSSFWGIQKIKLSKSKSTEKNTVIVKEPIIDTRIVESTLEERDESPNNLPLDSASSEDEGNTSNDLDDISTIDNEEVKEADEDLEYQKAPLVGTFYLSSKPGEASFVSIGDTVSKGQTLCIIEAMKIFNEIESDFDGEIVEILVNDESPVEFNQAIFSIRPN